LVVEEYLKGKNLPCVNIYSLQGRIALRNASVGIISNSLNDLSAKPFYPLKGIKLIQLFHGQSVKAVRFGRKNHKISIKESNERRLESKLVNYAISTSDFTTEFWDKCMEFGHNKYVVTGYPRNDSLLKVPKNNINKWHDFIGSNNSSKIIFYAPTWRHGRSETKFFPFNDFKKNKLITYLDANDFTLLLRPHKHDLSSYKNLRILLNDLTNSERIKLATHNEFVDANSFLPFVDILITDYSSIYHDFLLLNKPLIFIPYDYDDYDYHNGFLYDYYNYLPGPSVYSFDSLIKELDDIKNNDDNYIKKRLELRNKIHRYRDFSSCERVSNLVESLILKN
jgi:CDP-glycerol glycerophosphotransferase (TagB/SpsB family)|tara:strand:+ start:3848 stop:4861 length:1014 start_codon:yes stop_codon:yes gene_type:complete